MKGEHFMIKKFKRWYGNLKVYEKEEFFLTLFVIAYYILMIALDISGFFAISLYSELSLSGSLKLSLFGLFVDCLLVYSWIPLVIINIVANSISDKKIRYEMNTEFEKAEKEVKEYFEKSNNNIIEIVPKSSKGITDIIDFYHRKGKTIESYWAQLDEIYGKSVLYISVICIGETNRIVYPEMITNFCYLIDNFTFK